MSLLALGSGNGAPAQSLGTMLKINEKGGTIASSYPSVASFLNLLIPIIFVISGLVLLFLIIGGGFSIVASGGNAKSVESGKNQIMGAIIGFIIIFAAYWIIQIVQAFTGVPILNATL